MNINNYKSQETPIKTASTMRSTSFKAGMPNMLNVSGNIMQGIENSGFLGSFLIQDFVGMTIPRTAAGFLRDKEKTGEYNIQEGTEVFGREALTGPCMMAIAPIMLLLAAKFGRSTSVNSQLIKRFGNSLKEVLANPNFDKNLLKNPKEFKQEFYKTNIEKILKDTLGQENTTNEATEYILKQIRNMENIPKDVKLKKFRGKTKYKDECMNNIVEYINNIKYTTGSDLDMLKKVKFGSDKLDSKKVFSTQNTIDAMMKYTDDAITANKQLDKLDELIAESIKNKSLAKRLITNITMVATTLGVLSVLPKIYARSNVAPGARTAGVNGVNEKSDFNGALDTESVDTNTEQNHNNKPAFKGKQPNKGVLERIGKVIDKNKSDFLSSEFEYNGHNFTNSLMASLSLFGLLTPRGMRAYNRAQVDENGKKDLTEVYEILLRDVTSSLTVVFAVPMLTRAFVTSYEKQSGFVLMQKDRTPKSKFQTIRDLLNPYSKAHVLTNSEINALYNNINNKEKMLNFCKYIDKNGGDLEKILSKSEHSENLLKDLSVLSKNEKNKKITALFEKMDKTKADDCIKRIMKTVNKSKFNKITMFARGLTSIPGLLTTVFISPYLLGWFIPRLTYKNTQRIHEKQDREREARKLQQTA